MTEANKFSSDVAFTPAVKTIQARKRSRRAYGNMEQRGSWPTRISADLAAFIESQISNFLGTATSDGQPYIQHRGGPPGFQKVLDDKTIGFAGSSATANTSRSAICPKPEGAPVPDRLRPAAAHQDLGGSACGRGRRRSDHPADAAGLHRAQGRRSFSPSRPGTQIVSGTFRDASRPPTWRQCWLNAMDASRPWRLS
jgi:hypothetical protein